MSEPNQLTKKSTKDRHRWKIWEYMMDNDLINFPLIIYHRIPNFKGADLAAERLAKLDEFKNAQVIKINPDKPQEPVRLMALKAKKEILVPSSRLKSGLFFHVKPPPAKSKKTLQNMATFRGICTNGKPVDVDFNIKVDLVVLGAVCVSRKGYRIGRGEGFSDLEFAMMKKMGAICDKTIIVTTIHDCQLVDNLDDELFGEHDVPVDIIVTPTQTIFINERLKKPSDINWHKLTPRIVSTRMLEQLNKIKQRNDDSVAEEILQNIPKPERQQKKLTRYKRQKKKKSFEKVSIDLNIDSQNGNQVIKDNKTLQENSIKVRINNQKENETQKNNKERKSQRKNIIKPKVEGHNDNKVPKENQIKTPQKVINIEPKTNSKNENKAMTQNKIKILLQESNIEPRNDDHDNNKGQQRNKGKKYSSRRQKLPKKIQMEKVNIASEAIEKNEKPIKESSKNENERRKPKKFKSRSRIDFSLKLSNVGSDVRIRDLKNELIKREVKPSYITWVGKSGYCYLHFNKLKKKRTQANEAIQVDSIVGNLQQLYVGDPKNMRNDNLIIVQPACPITRIEVTDVTSV